MCPLAWQTLHLHSPAGERGLLVCVLYIQARDDDMNTQLEDDKYESNVTSNSVRVLEDVPRSLPSPVLE